jgi:hypothetical protein
MDLRQTFWNVTKQTALSYGYGIAPGCETHLQIFIEGGVKQIEVEQLRDHAQRVDEAETNLVDFVGGMVTVAKQLSMTELHEETFLRTKASFCPLWPFC